MILLSVFLAFQVMAASVIAGMLWDLYHPEDMPTPASYFVPAPRRAPVPLGTVTYTAVLGALRTVVVLDDGTQGPCEQRANWRCPCGG